MSADTAGVWAAPGRVNLIGEHTDYNDGFCLPFALPLQITAAVSLRTDGRWMVSSTSESEPVEFGADDRVEGWASYVAGVVWVLRKAGYELSGASIAIDSDLPTGAGLSSSAALEAVVLLALNDLHGLGIPPMEQARLAQGAENDYVGMPCGLMDQTASIMCQRGHALFFDVRESSTRQVPFDVVNAGLAMLVINTNAPHQLVDGEYAARRRSCEEAARILGVPALRDVSSVDLPSALSQLDAVAARRVRHVVTENERVLSTVDVLSSGDPRRIGELLTASHNSLRDDFEVTVPQLDVAAETAVTAGAYGARMTGGGFGGCVIALVDTSRAEFVAAAVSDAFAANGFAAPEWFLAEPSDGARRLD